MARYKGRHRAPTKRAVNLARIAVGGLALAEITGGLGAVPAWASPAPVLARHHDHHAHGRHREAQHPAGAPHAKPAARPAPVTPVAVAAPAAPPLDPAPQPAPAATDLFDHYVVQDGDTLTHIAAAYQIPWESLWAVNSDLIDHPDLIFPGQRLRLPT